MFWTLFIIFCIILFSLYIVARLTLGISNSPRSLLGKTAIITGANSGVGLATALNLASRGCRIIMADVADMKQSKNRVIEESGNPNIVTKFLDLSSFKSVRAFADDIKNEEQEVHILLNNAGVLSYPKEVSEDGFNAMMQINYLGHFLLTHLLVDLLKKSSARIVFTSSCLAFFHNMNAKHISFTKSKESLYSDAIYYGNSKLCVIIASDIFAETLQEAGVTSNSIHPGIVYTTIFEPMYAKYLSQIYRKLYLVFMWMFAKTPWEGAQTLVHCAVSKELQGVTGQFYSDCRPFNKPLLAYNKDFCRSVWRMSEEAVGLKKSEKLTCF